MPEEVRAVDGTITPDPSPRAERLHTEATGTGRRLVLVHGFTQTGRCWGPMADDLAADHRLVLVDLPGHGGSGSVDTDLNGGADLLVTSGGRGGYVGYSMGARFCLHAALAHPGAVSSLVLVSGTAGLEDPVERRDRRLADDALADALAPASGATPTVSVERFLHRWLAQPMFAGVDDASASFVERARNSAPGLASSLRRAGTGTQVPLWDRLEELEMPVLSITGELDQKFTELGRRMVRAIGANASIAVVAGAGHAPHLERPAEVAAAIRAFVDGASNTPDRIL
jgi:2-succinyl-6-hydroxy-2,4-cyclohexadiene-1-carboxylate synthase